MSSRFWKAFHTYTRLSYRPSQRFWSWPGRQAASRHGDLRYSRWAHLLNTRPLPNRHTLRATAPFLGPLVLSLGLILGLPRCYQQEHLNRLYEIVVAVTGEQDIKTRLDRYWEAGETVLADFADGEVTRHPDLKFHYDEDVYECIQTRFITAPDPDFPGEPEKLFLVAQAIYADVDDSTIRATDDLARGMRFAKAVMEEYEQIANDLGAVRGALVVIDEDGNWASIYYDGKRFLNVNFSEFMAK